ncbi:hypothetical protein HMPREF3033_01394 [Veillonellaceae bacterium DNF00751]|nr:hypothetical protein HMPREF3033_01394 [Veillonellaceae bacterium DNF00751]
MKIKDKISLASAIINLLTAIILLCKAYAKNKSSSTTLPSIGAAVLYPIHAIYAKLEEKHLPFHWDNRCFSIFSLANAII